MIKILNPFMHDGQPMTSETPQFAGSISGGKDLDLDIALYWGHNQVFVG